MTTTAPPHRLLTVILAGAGSGSLELDLVGVDGVVGGVAGLLHRPGVTAHTGPDVLVNVADLLLEGGHEGSVIALIGGEPRDGAGRGRTRIAVAHLFKGGPGGEAVADGRRGGTGTGGAAPSADGLEARVIGGTVGLDQTVTVVVGETALDTAGTGSHQVVAPVVVPGVDARVWGLAATAYAVDLTTTSSLLPHACTFLTLACLYFVGVVYHETVEVGGLAILSDVVAHPAEETVGVWVG